MFVSLRCRGPGRRLSTPCPAEESVAQPGAQSAHVVDLAVAELPGSLRPGAAGGAGAVLGTVGPRPPRVALSAGVVRGVAGAGLVPQPRLQGQSLLPGAARVT